MAVTMREVAARAGVSPVVVSRVLHNKAKSIRVSEETAERVRRAAKDLGYRCNVWARNFRNQQTRMIGVVHGMGFGRPKFNDGSRYFSALMDGLVDGAFDHDYSLTLCPQLLGQTPEDAMSDGRFDGLVWYSTALDDATRKMLANCSVPLVLIHTAGREVGGKYSSVICDNDQGMRLAVEHLAELGHRRIAFAAQGAPPHSESQIRLAAFEKHMKLLGLPFGNCDVVLTGWDGEGIDAYLDAVRGHTAVVTHNEGLAGQFLARAPYHGLEVPRDLSIVGFDSTAFCLETRPTLTAVSQPLSYMGQKAIELLIGSISEDQSPVEVIFPCGFDIRGSTQTIHR
jgi:LacI family transcriptional regulator